jgi:hypothetical protein
VRPTRIFKISGLVACDVESACGSQGGGHAADPIGQHPVVEEVTIGRKEAEQSMGVEHVSSCASIEFGTMGPVKLDMADLQIFVLEPKRESLETGSSLLVVGSIRGGFAGPQGWSPGVAITGSPWDQPSVGSRHRVWRFRVHGWHVACFWPMKKNIVWWHQ